MLTKCVKALIALAYLDRGKLRESSHAFFLNSRLYL